MPKDDFPDPKFSFEEAVAWFFGKRHITKAEWDKLRAKARRRAFTVANVVQADIVNDVYKALQQAVKEGTSLHDFRQSIVSRLQDAWQGTVANPGWRIEIIYRTNLQNAYSAGRWKQMRDPDVARLRPYGMFDAVMDNRVTSICASLNGVVRPMEEFEQLGLIPPLHFGCRSQIRSLRKSQAEKRGISSKMPGIKAQEGFGEAPGVDEWGPDLEKYPEEIGKELRKRLEEAFKPEPVAKPEPEKALTEEQSTKLINEILDNDKQPSDTEIRLLQRRMADAGFVEKRVSVNRCIVGRSFGGIELGSKATSLIAHTAKRVLVDREWSPDTTPEQYVTDLLKHALDAAAKVVVYERNNKRYVATISPTVLPEKRQGDQLKPWLCVIYSIDDGKIITGYQIEKVEDLKTGDKAKWLK